MNFAKQYDTGKLALVLPLTEELWEKIENEQLPLELGNCSVHAVKARHYFKLEKWFCISQFSEDSVWRAEINDYLVIGPDSVDSISPTMFDLAYSLLSDDEQVGMIKLFQNYDLWLTRISGAMEPDENDESNV